MKAQSSKWKPPSSPCPKKVSQSPSKIKTRLTVFFWLARYCPSWIYYSRPNNKEFYLSVLHQLRDAIWNKWPQIWAIGDWQLHHNNKPAHTPRLLQSFFFFWETWDHPGNSAPLQSRIDTLQLLAFWKIRITFAREDISDHWWDSGKYNKAAYGDSNAEFCSVLNSGRDIRRIMCGPMVPTLREKRCHGPMYNVSCIFSNKCLHFHNMWLDTFWTNFI